jgi:adenine deaminase
LLREGSVAKNLEELCGVLNDFSSPHVSLCTDDRNPMDILDEGHLDYLIRLAIKKGVAPAAAYRAASLSTAKCFGIKNKGALAPGYEADIVALKDYRKCVVDKVFKRGEMVDMKTLDKKTNDGPRENTINCVLPTADQLRVPGPGRFEEKEGGDNRAQFRVIGIVPNSIVTENLTEKLVVLSGEGTVDLKRDVLKIAVLERYGHGSPPSVGFVKGMSLKAGAIGSSVGHDSHNMVSIGTNNDDMIKAFERMKELGGGFVVVRDGRILAELALPIAGLMTTAPLKDIYKNLKKLKGAARDLGCRLSDPFLQMAFLCLPVIPTLKITDKGLVDVNQFKFVPAAVV